MVTSRFDRRSAVAMLFVVTFAAHAHVSSAAAQTAQAPTATASVAGTWGGHISVPPGPLEVSVVLAQDASTMAWSGTIDIPAQGASGLPLAEVSVDGRSVVFAIAKIPGTPTFRGDVSADGSTFTGTFSQGQAAFPFELRRGAKTAVMNRPQQPRPPFPYREESVSYRNEGATVRLAGTLTLPQGTGPFPAVLLISGSGSQDRDNTILGHKSFLLMADALTRRGVAVLRVDDRGVGGSDRGLIEPTSLDLAGDVRAGIAFLAGRSDIRRDRIGLIGHSEGALIAPMVAAHSTDVAFVVMLAGSAVRGDVLLMQQVEAIAGAQGVPRNVIDWDLAMRRRVYDVINAEVDGQVNTAARQAIVESVPPIPGTPDVSAARENVQLLLQASSGRWFRYFLSYDPAPALAQVTVPVLALGGQRDAQVLPGPNLAAVRAALKAGGNTDATVEELPGLNHMFQTSATGNPSEYGTIEETMAPAALDRVVEWVLSHVR